MDETYIDEQFIRERITHLRLAKGVSEREMSLSIGMCESYIRNITSSTSLPSMSSFLNICDYFGVTPSEFFDHSLNDPTASKEALAELERLFGRKLPLVTDWLKKLDKSHGDLLVEIMRIK